MVYIYIYTYRYKFTHVCVQKNQICITGQHDYSYHDIITSQPHVKQHGARIPVGLQGVVFGHFIGPGSWARATSARLGNVATMTRYLGHLCHNIIQYIYI